MPCGGINVYTDVIPGKCWYCEGENANHYCEEWDCMLHDYCVIPFLMTDEGKLVIQHGHPVTIYFSGAESWQEMEKNVHISFLIRMENILKKLQSLLSSSKI
jgi:hypothetical protein